MTNPDMEAKLKSVEPFIGSWKTSLIDVQPNKIWIRGYPIEQLIGRFSYAELCFLVFKGELPSEKDGKLLNAVLTSCLVAQTPSSPMQTVPRIISSSNPSTIGGMIGALACVGPFLAVGEQTGELLDRAFEIMKKENLTEAQAADKVTAEYGAKKKRIPSLGHPIHKIMDPRATALHKLAEEIDAIGPHTRMYDLIYDAYKRQTGKQISMNVDSYVSTFLMDLGFPRSSLTGMLMLTMFPGIIASVCEEVAAPLGTWRGIPGAFWEYTGPAHRDVPKSKK